MGNLDRIATYVNWPASNMSISCLSLANAGFVYSGDSDQVTCPLCGLVVGDWRQRTCSPFIEHRLSSPHCPFFSESSTNVSQLSSVPRHSCPMTDIGAVYRSALERANRRPTSSRDQDIAAVTDRANPDYVLLKDETVRLSTFYDWPASDTVQPSSLARCGLFYTGQADRTQCVFCRGVLHHWQPADQPDIEHQRLFPHCPFVRHIDVGNVPLQRDHRHVAPLGINDVTPSTSGDVTQSTSGAADRFIASSDGATSSLPADVAAMNSGQGHATHEDSGHQTGLLVHNSTDQQTNQTLGMFTYYYIYLSVNMKDSTPVQLFSRKYGRSPCPFPYPSLSSPIEPLNQALWVWGAL